MDIDPSDRSALDRMVAELRELHGDQLLAVALTGDAVGPAYRPRKTSLATVVVLREVTPDALRRTRDFIRRWRRRNIAIPILMDPRYIESSLDVFPIEFIDFSDRHLLLYGDSDPLSDLPVDRDHLRLELEEQLRGKLLHLWGAYLSTEGTNRNLRALLLDTPAGFEVILRGMARLRGHLPSDAPLDAVEASFAIELPTFRRLIKLRSGKDSIPRNELEATFGAYLSEVRRLVQLADAL